MVRMIHPTTPANKVQARIDGNRLRASLRPAGQKRPGR